MADALWDDSKSLENTPFPLNLGEKEGDHNPAGNAQPHQKCFVQEI